MSDIKISICSFCVPRTMRAVILILIFSVIFKCSEGGAWSKCHVDGVVDYEFMTYHTIKEPIDETYEGVVATFTTKYITGMRVEEASYLNATFKDGTITIFTTEAFKNFEKEVEKGSNQVSIKLDFDCDGGGEGLNIQQQVTDINNHYPITNQIEYKYSFGIAIPQNYELDPLLSISAYDGDFMNRNIYFTIEENEYLKVGREGNTKSGTDSLFTTLRTLKDIKPPFKQEYTLTATDEGNPPKSTEAKIILSVTSDEEKEEERPASEETGDTEDFYHPPVFSKQLYYANYTSNNGRLEMEEPILIVYGVQRDIIIEHSGYSDYFSIGSIYSPETETQELKVAVLEPLPNTILQKHFIVIEIKVENAGLAIPGRTALIISLNKSGEDSKDEESPASEGDSKEDSNDCEDYIWGFSYSHSVVPIIICLSSLVIIVFVNILVLFLCFGKQKRALAPAIQPVATAIPIVVTKA